MSEVKDIYNDKYHLVNNEIIKYLDKFFRSINMPSIGGETPEGVDIKPPLEIIQSMDQPYGIRKCTINLLDLNMEFHLLEEMGAGDKKNTYIFYALEMHDGIHIQLGQFTIGSLKAEVLREALEYIWKYLMASSKYNNNGIDIADAHKLHSIIDHIYYIKTVYEYGFDFRGQKDE